MDSSVPPLPRDSPWLKGTDARHAKSSERRASNRVKVPPASPEVISSLISSLSAISTPAEDLFDSLLPTTSTPAGSVPPSPTISSGFAHTSGNPSARASLSADSEVYQDAQNKVYLHPDDAAIPPVIRTSKPPSGFSPLTAPKKVSPRSSKLSGWSLLNSHDPLPSRSIGSVSIGSSPGRSSTSVNTIESGKTGSGKSLSLRVSKERMREIDRERKKKLIRSAMEDGAKSPTKLSVNGTEQQSENRYEEKPLLPPLPPSDTLSAVTISAPGSSTYSASSDANSSRGASEERPGGIGSGRTIPVRESSLRHKSSSASPKRKRKSYRNSGVNGEPQLNNHSELPELGAPRVDEPGIDVPINGHANKAGNEDDGVVKRIRELKAQKELRRLESQGRAHSDDEGQRGRDKPRDKKATLGRSSLPAPSAPKVALIRSVSDSEAFGKENRNLDDPKPLESPRGAPNMPRAETMPAMPVVDRRGRVASNQVSQGARMTIVDDRPSSIDSIDDAVEDYMAASRLSQCIYHPQTGRSISFSEVGDPRGSVVFCCVGMGTTRYLTAFYDELAISLKLRLITLDRPGIGDSQAYADGSDTPLGWPDDIRAVCQHLGISRFSLLAHSAGAIYALATALRMPQHIRGRIHLLAPWIPPSQMVAIGIHQERVPVTSLPYSQRILRSLPTPFLKAANSSFFSVTSNSITTSLPKSPRRAKRRSIHGDIFETNSNPPKGSPRHNRRSSAPLAPKPEASSLSVAEVTADVAHDTEAMRVSEKLRQSEYDSRLTQAIWATATTNANPAVDLLVCLERRQEIGFRYVDINKAVVIHHGSRDTRVPIENVKWLGKTMRRCEVRILEGEGHGLMASATVMSAVLGEVAKEWEDWNAVIGAKKREKRQ